MSIKIGEKTYVTEDPVLAAQAAKLSEYTWANGAWVWTRGNTDDPPVVMPGPRTTKTRLVEFLGRFHWFRRIVGFQ